jgi:hypothetical protein
MGRARIGDILVEEGLLTPGQLAVLLRDPPDGRRLGQRARERGWVSEDGVARALAQQYRVNMVPTARLETLEIDGATWARLPVDLVHARQLFPTFLDPDTGVLTVVTGDPTDRDSLRAAQDAAGARRLRIFVAPETAVRRYLEDREAATVKGQLPPELVRVRTIVLEPDPRRAGALEALERADGGHARVVADPDAVARALEETGATRVLVRRGAFADLGRHAETWRRARPGLLVRVVEGHGPGRRDAAGWREATPLVTRLAGLALDARDPSGTLRGAAERLQSCVRTMLTRDGHRDEVGAAGALLALLVALAGPFTPEAVLAVVDSGSRWPLDVDGSARTLARRMAAEEGPGADVVAEYVFTAAAWWHAGGDRLEADPVTVLGTAAAAHDAAALRALTAVWRATRR